MQIRLWKVRRNVSGVLVLAAALVVLAGCGSSSKTSTTGSTAAASSSTSSTSTANYNKVYVAGVPTLKELTTVGGEENPPTSSPPPAKGKSVWWISCGQSVPGCSQPAAGAAAAAKVLGWNFHIANGNLGIGGGYITAMDTALAAHASAILVHGIDCPAMEAPLRQAKADHIPVIGVEDNDCSATGGPTLFAGPMMYTSTELSAPAYFSEWGKVSADAVIDLTQGKAKVLLAGGVPGFTTSVLIAQGFETELKKCQACSVVGEFTFSPADEVPNGPYVQELRADILKYSNANAVMTPVDPAAQFGAPAVHAANPNTANVGGSGGAPDLILIRQGILTAATGAHDATWMGWAAIDETNRILNNKPTVPEGVGFKVITKVNDPAPGQNYVSPINYKADYTKIWTGN
jgi:ribose transport system substrate-binding protein